MRILLDGKPKTLARAPKNGLALLQALGISPQEALLKVDGNVRPESVALGKRARIEVIRVVFGG